MCHIFQVGKSDAYSNSKTSKICPPFFSPQQQKNWHQSTEELFPCNYLTKTCFISLLINLVILNEILQRPSHHVN